MWVKQSKRNNKKPFPYPLKPGKKHTIELIAQLKKEHKSLKKKDEFQTEILFKVIQEADTRMKWNQWEVGLDIILEAIQQYQIPVGPKTKELVDKGLNNMNCMEGPSR